MAPPPGLDDAIVTLSQAPLLGDLEPEALRMLAAGAQRLKLRANEVLFRQGERSDGGYVVVDGELALARSGTDAVTLAGPGALVGQIALFVRGTRPASAVARVRTNVLRISPTLMRRVLEAFPSAAETVRTVMVDDLGELTGRLDKVRRMLAAIDAR